MILKLVYENIIGLDLNVKPRSSGEYEVILGHYALKIVKEEQYNILYKGSDEPSFGKLLWVELV